MGAEPQQIKATSIATGTTTSATARASRYSGSGGWCSGVAGLSRSYGAHALVKVPVSGTGIAVSNTSTTNGARTHNASATHSPLM